MMSDNINTREAYVVVEYVASVPARQLYKIADVDGTIYGEDLCAVALANKNTSVFMLAAFSNEISARAKAHSGRFLLYKNRNVYEIGFRAVGRITLMWRDDEPAPVYPNECAEHDEVGFLHPQDWQRYWVGGMTRVSTNLPHSISKEQWQKR